MIRIKKHLRGGEGWGELVNIDKNSLNVERREKVFFNFKGKKIYTVLLTRTVFNKKESNYVALKNKQTKVYVDITHLSNLDYLMWCKKSIKREKKSYV